MGLTMRYLVILVPLAVMAILTTSCGSQPRRAQASDGYVRVDDGVRLYYQSVGEGPSVLVVPIAVGVGRRRCRDLNEPADVLIHGKEDGIPLAGAYAWTRGYPI